MAKKIIGIICIVAGIGLIAYALITRAYYDNVNISLVEYYENEYETVLGDFREEETELPTTDIEITTVETITQATTKDVTANLPVDVIGIITINKIGLKAAIAEGSDYHTIRYSIGHFENTPLPADGGNFCILGHRSYTYGQFFNRVEELAINDIIDINIKGVGYVYQIYDIYITEPTNMSVLDNSDQNEITIVTCTKNGKKRVIVKGIMLNISE